MLLSYLAKVISTRERGGYPAVLLKVLTQGWRLFSLLALPFEITGRAHATRTEHVHAGHMRACGTRNNTSAHGVRGEREHRRMGVLAPGGALACTAAHMLRHAATRARIPGCAGSGKGAG